jgi:hypothetical protein
MRVLYVIECDIPTAADVAEPIKAMRPPMIPYFAGAVRVVIEPEASALVTWLDEQQ